MTAATAPAALTTPGSTNISPAPIFSLKFLQPLSEVKATNNVVANNSSLANLQLGRLDSVQTLALLRCLPGVFHKLSVAGLKEGLEQQSRDLLVAHNPNGLSDLRDDGLYNAQDQEPDYNPGDSTGHRQQSETKTDERIRRRKNIRKEAERRRRKDINEGLNDLAKIVPSTIAGKQVKGAILTRALQYIQQLKDNEVRNIEKWTLEKLLVDQAMGDLQAQTEEIFNLWEEQCQAREAAEKQVQRLAKLLEEKSERLDAATGWDAEMQDEGARKRQRFE